MADVRRIGGRKVAAGDSRRAERRRAAYDKGVKTLDKVLKDHVYICGVSRKNALSESFIKCANAGLNCVDSIIAASSNSNRHYKLHLILYADAQTETSLPSCNVSNRSTRARTEGR